MNHDECKTLLSELSDYIDGDLGQAMCDEIERHLAECENCRVVVDTLRKTVELYQTRGSEPLPEGVQERLYRVLELDDFTGGQR